MTTEMTADASLPGYKLLQSNWLVLRARAASEPIRVYLLDKIR